MAGSESDRHRELKRLALAWALEQSYAAAAPEVSLPNLRFRLDLAAYRPARRGRETILGTTAIFECKQARADFLRDSRRTVALLARLESLHVRRAHHEATLKLHYPTLRTGDSLFPEYEAHDFARSGDKLFLRVATQIATAQRQLYGQTKFEKLQRWRAANLHYAVTEPEVLKSSELPEGWGLLVRSGENLELVRKPWWQDVSEGARLLLLQRIACAGTRSVQRELARHTKEIASIADNLRP